MITYIQAGNIFQQNSSNNNRFLTLQKSIYESNHKMSKPHRFVRFCPLANFLQPEALGFGLLPTPSH